MDIFYIPANTLKKLKGGKTEGNGAGRHLFGVVMGK